MGSVFDTQKISSSSVFDSATSSSIIAEGELHSVTVSIISATASGSVNVTSELQSVTVSSLFATAGIIDLRTDREILIDNNTMMTDLLLICGGIIDGVLSTDIEHYHGTVGIAGAVGHLKHIEARLVLDTELAEVGDGSQKTPFNDSSILIDYAEAHGIRDITLYSELEIDRNIKGFVVKGKGLQRVTCGGNDLKDSEFYHCELSGQYINSIIAQECTVLSLTTANGFFEKCAIGGSFVIPDQGFAYIEDCSTFREEPIIDVGTFTGTGELLLNGHKGDVTIINVNKITDGININMSGGTLTIDASCTNGQWGKIQGHGTFINNSLLNIDTSLLEPSKLNETYISAANHRYTDEVTKEIILYKDDGVTVHSKFDYEENSSGQMIRIVPK